MNLLYVPNLLEGGDTLAHDRDFPLSVKNFLYGDGGCVASVDDSLVISYWRENATFVEDAPVLLDQIE